MALETTFIVSWTNPAGSSKGDVVVATIQTDPKRPGSEAYVVPQGKVVVVKDLTKGETTAASYVGGVLEFIVNDTEIVARTKDIKNYDPANPSRPTPPAIVLYPGDTLKINVYVNPNGDTVDITETAELTVLIMDEAGFEDLLVEE